MELVNSNALEKTAPKAPAGRPSALAFVTDAESETILQGAFLDAAPISRKLGKLISFVGARGGVGTSTMAVNLSCYFAHQKARRVALLDLDLHNGVCSLMLNLPTSSGLRDALENPSRVDSLFLER